MYRFLTPVAFVGFIGACIFHLYTFIAQKTLPFFPSIAGFYVGNMLLVLPMMWELNQLKERVDLKEFFKPVPRLTYYIGQAYGFYAVLIAGLSITLQQTADPNFSLRMFSSYFPVTFLAPFLYGWYRPFLLEQTGLDKEQI